VRDFNKESGVRIQETGDRSQESGVRIQETGLSAKDLLFRA